MFLNSEVMERTKLGAGSASSNFIKDLVWTLATTKQRAAM
jgi:hypothetical protein